MSDSLPVAYGSSPVTQGSYHNFVLLLDKRVNSVNLSGLCTNEPLYSDVHEARNTFIYSEEVLFSVSHPSFALFFGGAFGRRSQLIQNILHVVP